MQIPAVILAADHRARGVVTIERYADYLTALRAALPSCDGLMASVQPLADLRGDLTPGQSAWLSLNRTGLAGAAFELDDRLVASVDRAAAAGCDGVKVMTRIDLRDRSSAAALELLGKVLEESAAAGLPCMVEPLSWKDGAIDRTVDSIVFAAVIAHDMGAPLLKVPVPTAPPGPARIDAARRVVESVGVPVLFLGGPRGTEREDALAELADGMAAGGAGAIIGRAVYQDPDPAGMAKLVAEVVHR